jgi:hypothetical protein
MGKSWRLFLLVCAIAAAVSAQQQPQPPSERPFIEPAEHRHGVRSARLRVKPAGVDKSGWWITLPVMMPINPVHLALMRNGKVLVISGSGNDPDNHVLTAGVFDPPAQTITTFNIEWDMFCNGMVILPDGRPFVLGGTIRYDNWLGEFHTAFFDPDSGKFTNGPNMDGGRWYPTGTVLGDGSVMVISGLNQTVQIYKAETNSWTPAGIAFPRVPLYPRQHVLPDGMVFESGANPDTKLWDPVKHTWTNMPKTKTKFGKPRDYGSSVLLPLTPENKFKAKVLILGGGRGTDTGIVDVTDTTETLDFADANPVWTFGPKMIAPRVQVNATLLPNGKVLISGGSTVDEKPSTGVLGAELYDPATNTLAPAGKMEFPRVYHSNTLLLPDATVLAAGGNPERTVYEPHIEIYQPPYLFKANGDPAPRPAMSAVGDHIPYGGTFTVSSASAASIRSVVLIRAGAVTHAFDMDQRLVGMSFSASGDTLTIQAPADGNIAPPGWYLLFVVDASGAPSVGQFVRVG